MSLFAKTKTVKSTNFSDFIRNAPSRDKKKVYNFVLKKATEDQVAVLQMAASAKK
jgi:hypothetical protein